LPQNNAVPGQISTGVIIFKVIIRGIPKTNRVLGMAHHADYLANVINWDGLGDGLT
jgi:hypothetical protein